MNFSCKESPSGKQELALQGPSSCASSDARAGPVGCHHGLTWPEGLAHFTQMACQVARHLAGALWVSLEIQTPPPQRRWLRCPGLPAPPVYNPEALEIPSALESFVPRAVLGQSISWSLPRMKYWSCCGIKTTDFSAFLEQRGCSTGMHAWTHKQVSGAPESAQAKAHAMLSV